MRNLFINCCKPRLEILEIVIILKRKLTWHLSYYDIPIFKLIGYNIKNVYNF
jgi:hypothetical protein